MGRILDLFINKYNYTDFHELNLDWIISDLRTLAETLENFININTIKYANPIQWNITTQYEANTVVIDANDGTAYLSVKPVPSGVALTNTDYWTPIFTLNLLSANQNITLRDDGSNVLATFTSAIGDWLIWNNTLYKVTRPIAINEAYVSGYNLDRYSVELFIKDYIDSLITIIGDLDDLTTAEKSSIVNAINELVTDINNITTTINIDTVSTMKATELTEDSFCRTAGYHSVNDGGGAFYHITSTAPAGHYETLDNGLYAELIYDNCINVKQMGAYGDDVHDDTSIIQAAIDYSVTSHNIVFIPVGVYLVSALTLTNGCSGIRGEVIPFCDHYAEYGYPKATTIKSIYNANDTIANYLITSAVGNYQGGVEISNITFYGNNQTKSCLSLQYSGWTLYMKNVTIDYFQGEAIKFDNTYDSNIEGLTIERCARYVSGGEESTYAIHCVNTPNAIHFNMLHMEFNGLYMLIESCQNIDIVNSKFEIGPTAWGGYERQSYTNPYFKINKTMSEGIIFSATHFILAGSASFKRLFPAVDYSDFPYTFEIYTTGAGTPISGLSFIGCIINGVDVNGGVDFIDNSNAMNMIIDGCQFSYLNNARAAIVANEAVISNNKMTLYNPLYSGTVNGLNLTNCIITGNNITSLISASNIDAYNASNNNCMNNVGNYIRAFNTMKVFTTRQSCTGLSDGNTSTFAIDISNARFNSTDYCVSIQPYNTLQSNMYRFDITDVGVNAFNLRVTPNGTSANVSVMITVSLSK